MTRRLWFGHNVSGVACWPEHASGRRRKQTCRKSGRAVGAARWEQPVGSVAEGAENRWQPQQKTGVPGWKPGGA